MKRFSRRLAAAALVALPLLAAPAMSQAGVIPWVYDVIFGPVGYPPGGYGYMPGPYSAPGPYAVSYRGGYGCSSCGPVCSPCSAPVASACSSGACQGVVSFYSATAACDSQSTWKSDAPKSTAGTPKKTEPTPADTTFDESGQDGLLKKEPFPAAATPVKPTSPASGSSSVTAGSQTNSATGVSSDDTGLDTGAGGEFAAPKVGTTPEPAPATGTKTQGLDGTTNPLNLDNKTSWNVTPAHRRLAQRATFRDAQVARRTVPVKADALLPTQSGARVAAR